MCKLFRLQTRGWGSSCLVWMPPHTGSLINTLFNDASWLTRHPRVKQSTATYCAGVLDISSWFLVLLLLDWYVYLIGGGPHTGTRGWLQCHSKSGWSRMATYLGLLYNLSNIDCRICSETKNCFQRIQRLIAKVEKLS